VIAPNGQRLGVGQSFLEFGGEFVCTHGVGCVVSCFASANAGKAVSVKARDVEQTGRLIKERNAEWHRFAHIPVGLWSKMLPTALQSLVGATPRPRFAPCWRHF
jgi:hypothetical protein